MFIKYLLQWFSPEGLIASFLLGSVWEALVIATAWKSAPHLVGGDQACCLLNILREIL